MQLTRSELYKKVCEMPLSKLAPELGTSGTALAAVCRQHQIPYPGSGYWTRKSLSLPAELPTLPDGGNDTIEITARPVLPKKPRRMAEQPAPPKLKSPARRRRAEHHPLLFGAMEHFRKTRTVKTGEFLRPYKRLLPDVISSEDALPHAVAIANGLYLALDQKGFCEHT